MFPQLYATAGVIGRQGDDKRTPPLTDVSANIITLLAIDGDRLCEQNNDRALEFAFNSLPGADDSYKEFARRRDHRRSISFCRDMRPLRKRPQGGNLGEQRRTLCARQTLHLLQL